MGIREKYQVPDWVVDNYNSRVSEDAKLPIGSSGSSSHDEFNSFGNYSEYKYYSDRRDYYKRERKYSDISEDFMCKFAMFLWLFLSFIFLSFIL